MWHQPSAWPDTTKLSSDENGRQFCLTAGHAVRYAQKQAKRLFFGNVTAFLSLFGSCGKRHGNLFGLPGTIPRSVIVPKTPKWQNRRIIPA